ncbi:metal-dependent hydrolase [Candidatus Pacearchaeota archaeon]|nr:metal-dependent hydrolase [Candidatus Pacearchaeota archaeon]
MLIRTHLLIALFFALLLLPYAESKLVFIIVVLIASFIPDVDSKCSKLGRKKTFRILQFFVKHRGILHSFTFLIIISLIFLFVFPIIVFPFFLGYGLHLLIDSFTKQGIRPFYPFKYRMRGIIKTGGRFETFIFVIFLILDIIFIFEKVFGIF